MKFVFGIATLLFFELSIVAQDIPDEKTCSIMKQGRFLYLGLEDTTAYFVINKDEHVEYHDGGKYTIKSKLKWVNNCQYKMTLLSHTMPDFPFKKGDIMTVTIKKIEDGIIYYTSQVKESKWDGAVLKLE